MAVNGEELFSPPFDGGFYQTSTLDVFNSPIKINLKEESIVGEFDVTYGVREAIVEVSPVWHL